VRRVWIASCFRERVGAVELYGADGRAWIELVAPVFAGGLGFARAVIRCVYGDCTMSARNKEDWHLDAAYRHSRLRSEVFPVP
jgi:hypothetical protein